MDVSGNGDDVCGVRFRVRAGGCVARGAVRRSARILPLHHRRPNDLKKADAELEALERQGFGGFAGNVNMGSTYLRSTNDWATLRYTIEAAKKRGMRMWLYDENGYPSGTAGGYVTEGRPEWEARGLLIAATNVPAGASATLAPPPGTFRRACAFPFAGGRIDLAKGVEIPAPAAGASAFRVPEDRATGPSAGIFLATSDGARYYGSAQVSFAEKGETRLFLPFDAFNLFGGCHGDAGEHVVVDFREPLPMVR